MDTLVYIQDMYIMLKRVIRFYSTMRFLRLYSTIGKIQKQILISNYFARKILISCAKLANRQ
jgi:hypothetical protein